MARHVDHLIAQPELYGREPELHILADLLLQTREGAIPHVARVLGRPGYGKTALVEEVVDRARRGGWHIFRTAAHASQQHAAVAALRRLVMTGLAAFGGLQAKYTSGLESDLAASEVQVSRFEQAVVGLFEGLLLDHAVLIVIDDVQWLDTESAACLERLFGKVSSAPLFLLLAQRTDPVPHFGPELAVHDLTLKPLRTSAAQKLVVREFPAARAEVIDTILERANGVPIELHTLAMQAAMDGAESVADVLNSVKTVIADRVGAMLPDLREFLQLCSLINEPIELRILNHLAKEQHLLGLVGQLVPRYLLIRGGELRFTHAVVAEAIRKTIVVELPLQRRILNTLLALGEPTLKGYDRIVQHAAECGELDIEYAYLVQLARKAFSVQAYDASIAAFERALALRGPDDDVYVLFFNEYSIALRLCDRWDEALETLESGLRGAINRSIGGVGILASSLIWTIVVQEDCERALLRYRELLQLMTGKDRQDLLGVGAMLAMELLDRGSLDAIKVELKGDAQISQIASSSLLLAEARLMGQSGEFGGAKQRLEQVKAMADPQRSAHGLTAEIFALHLDFLENGCGVSLDRIPRLLRRGQRDMPRAVVLNVLEIGMYSDFAIGRWGDVLAKLDECSIRAMRCDLYRARALSMPLAIAAFTGQAPQNEDIIEADVWKAIRNEYKQRALLLGFWWAAYLHGRDAGQARMLAERLLPWLYEASYATAFVFPVSALLYASRATHEATLDMIAAREPAHDLSPWHAAQHALATGSARHMRGQAGSATLLAGAERAFHSLNAPFFAALAAQFAGTLQAGDIALLQTLQVLTVPELRTTQKNARAKSRRGDLMTPTLREMQVAELVAEGYPNKRIAEELVLSERTVEAHLANLFSKLAVSSRTQLTRWLMENRAAIA